MLSLVLVGCLAYSRGVFAIGQGIESRGIFCMTFLCYAAWQRLRCVASGILGIVVEDPPVLQHPACGLQAYPKALLAAEAAINTRGNAG